MEKPLDYCCFSKQEAEDARRELQMWYPDLDYGMPLYDLIRQAREHEKTAWNVLHPIAEELRIIADEGFDSPYVINLRRLADLLDP